MSKRQEVRQKSRIDAYIEEVIHQRTVQLAEAIIDGYQQRLNNYLQDSSKEFKEGTVQYDKVVLNLEKSWIEPDEQQKMNIEKVRNIQLGDKDKIFKVVLRRSHYLEGNKIDDYRVWSSAGIKTEDLKTKRQVETVTLESLIGYMAEKGIEYSEAERNLYRQHAPEQPLEKVEEGESAH